MFTLATPFITFLTGHYSVSKTKKCIVAYQSLDPSPYAYGGTMETPCLKEVDY